MEKCTNTVVNWMIRCNVINEEERELYKYALYSSFLLVSPLIFAGIMGICFGGVKQGIAIVLPFAILRKFCGGYHAKNLKTCILGSVLLLFLCIMLSMYVKYDWKLVITTIIASGNLIFISPIDNENRKISIDEKKKYKKVTFWGVVIFMLLIIFLSISEQYIYATCFSIGILLTAGLQIPCVIKKI